MKKIILSLQGAGIAFLLGVAAVAAASPSPVPSVPASAVPSRLASPVPADAPSTSAPAASPVATRAAASDDVIAEILGLTAAQVTELRHEGLSLAQIAERQKVDPQKLVDALVARWSSRIDVRLAAGAISADQATALKASLATQAQAMVDRQALGGMRGVAVGAGPANAQGVGAAMSGGAGVGSRARGAMAGRGAGLGGDGTCLAQPSATAPTAP